MKVDGIVPRPIYFVVAIFQGLDILYVCLVPEKPLRLVYEPWNDAIRCLLFSKKSILNKI